MNQREADFKPFKTGNSYLTRSREDAKKFKAIPGKAFLEVGINQRSGYTAAIKAYAEPISAKRNPKPSITMTEICSNIALVGMPGSGKSTVGAILAKELSRAFVDTDCLIERAQGRKLQHIVDRDGYTGLRKIEETVLLDLHVENCVIATGGSVVYSPRGMAHLKASSTIVFLNVELSALRARIHNYASRGIAKRPEQSFEDLFRERFELYARYADVTIDCTELSKEEVCTRVIRETQR